MPARPRPSWMAHGESTTPGQRGPQPRGPPITTLRRGSTLADCPSPARSGTESAFPARPPPSLAGPPALPHLPPDPPAPGAYRSLSPPLLPAAPASLLPPLQLRRPPGPRLPCSSAMRRTQRELRGESRGRAPRTQWQ